MAGLIVLVFVPRARRKSVFVFRLVIVRIQLVHAGDYVRGRPNQ
jgi:hypothetical protein